MKHFLIDDMVVVGGETGTMTLTITITSFARQKYDDVNVDDDCAQRFLRFMAFGLF